MKAIVTGAAGFIGSHMVELLLGKGFQVVGIDNMANGQQDNVDLFNDNQNYTFHNINLSEDFDDSIFKGVDYVFHMAALADIVPSIENPIKYHESNVTGTIRVLEASRKHKVKKVIYSASSSCYGFPDKYPTKESSEIRPEYPYAFTKEVGEQYTLFWGKLYNLPVISLRYFNVFGTRAKSDDVYGAVFKVFLSQKIHGKPLTIVGDGTQTRDFTYVTDIVEANLKAAESNINGEILNIGTGKPQTINYLAKLIGGTTVNIPKRPGEPDSTHADATKAKKLLKWEPKVSFEEGVEIMIDNIEYWKDTPVWEPETIDKATKTWFKYLSKKDRVLVTGGAGYVGAALVPTLLKKGYKVTVLDTMWFWESTEEYLEAIGEEKNPNLRVVKGDLRNKDDVISALQEVESVIHLACISNDPSSELDSDYTHSVNYDGSVNMIDLAKEAGVNRFIYASSSSVYGIKDEPNVTEELELNPLTQYSKLKVEIEKYLLSKIDNKFKGVVLRPSTVCGYSPRQRLDVVVNILTNFAVNKGRIRVFGGEQLRPNIHIKDMVGVYEVLLESPIDKINKKIYNAGYENLKVIEIANLVKEVVGDVEVEIVETDDLRSYHINSEKIKRELGFESKYKVKDAIIELKSAFGTKIKNVDDEKYFNVKVMKKIMENDN
tara:strand:- start:7077 stop:9059 length:1983 start_codon:yes stop_codon:yes gene_type:complete